MVPSWKDERCLDCEFATTDTEDPEHTVCFRDPPRPQMLVMPVQSPLQQQPQIQQVVAVLRCRVTNAKACSRFQRRLDS